MPTIEINYPGDLRTLSTHVRSGNTLTTDAPIDNKGKGEAFSPTDLLATSLGTCMITTIGIVAQTLGFNVDGTKIRVTKVMAENPRRVTEVIVGFDFPENNYSVKEKTMIENAARNCPVAKSLHQDLKQTVIFNY